MAVSPNKPPININQQHLDGSSDRISKISMNTSISGNPTTASVSDISQPNAPLLNKDRLAEQVAAEVPKESGALARNLLDASKEATTLLTDAPAHKQISSEFKGGQQVGVGNKAMAIVQPTENNDSKSNAFSEIDKSPASSSNQLQQRTINRSVSDLSGERGVKQKPTQQVKSVNEQVADGSVLASVDTKRVAALEQLFKGSTPNLNFAGPPEEGASAPSKETKMPVDKGDKGIATDEDTKRRLSTSSLDSVELPKPLVESINRSTGLDRKAEVPSPNLLLGEGSMQVPEEATESASKPDMKSDAPISGKPKPTEADKIGLDGQKMAKEAQVGRPSDKKVGPSKPDATTRQPGGEQTEKSGKAAPNKTVKRERPPNPMGRDANKSAGEKTKSVVEKPERSNKGENESALEVKNHQVVVNKLDKRKTNLEIVDLRDESVTGKMRSGSGDDELLALGDDKTTSGWISMDGVAVAQPVPLNAVPSQQPQSSSAVSPSEIIESRFHVDYSGRRRRAGQKDSIDSKQEEYIMNDIDNELEQDNKMRNRKYFVYVVHDGHFTAKKECIARIELPPKRRITLAEMRQLIASSQDISLSSLRRNRFKFVTETYRLLNENEDAAVLHQVYPTQGVFLKLNIPEQENQVYPFKGGRAAGGGTRLSSSSGATPSSLAQATIASRRRANVRPGRPSGATDPQTGAFLPAIEVGTGEPAASSYGRTRASSVGRKTRLTAQPPTRSKSSVQTGVSGKQLDSAAANRLPSIGRFGVNNINGGPRRSKLDLNRSPTRVATRTGVGGAAGQLRSPADEQLDSTTVGQPKSLSSAATDLGANVLSGAKRLFEATFNR